MATPVQPQTPSPDPTPTPPPPPRRRAWTRIGMGVALLAVVIALIAWFRMAPSASSGLSFAARRGPLEITVLEGGSLQALESQEIKCEVRVGYQGTKILKIVEEGYQVTESDVANQKVLVELDSTEIEKQLVQQEIMFQSSTAALTDALQGYDIQLNQNLSDIKAAEQKARFTRLDFGKFVGDALALAIIARLETNAPPEPDAGAATVPPTLGRETPRPSGLLAQLTASATVPGSLPDTLPAPIATPPAAPTAPSPNYAKATPALSVDFSNYASLEALGDGEAKQKLRKFEDDLQVAQKELGQARITLEGTRRLFDKGFVTKTDLQRDEIAYENSRLKVQTAETAQALFLKYEFIKTAEESLSKYTEATRELDRARKAAVSKLAQADAKLKSARAQYEVQSRQNKELKLQLGKCVIKATKPGLVVYGGNQQDGVYYGGEERIREGATVRERQAIITIPNLTAMAVNVKIHESYVKRVKKGQRAKITVDAFPDKLLEGEVSRVGVLPDSQNRWMNPDLKVYVTMITIQGSHDWTKPGMSAKVEIFVDRLPDVLQVPVQAVVPLDNKRFCHVLRGGRTERREVQVGQFNDEFIEVKSGLEVGDRVLLRPPELTDTPGGEPSAPKPSDPHASPAAPKKTASTSRPAPAVPATPG